MITAMGYAGSERTTRRAVAEIKAAWHAGRRRVHRPWVTEPGMWREEALAAIEEAVTTYRELAQARPDAFLPNLATSLNNLASVLTSLGRTGEANAAQAEADGIASHGR
jgi:hypothetical protein